MSTGKVVETQVVARTVIHKNTKLTDGDTRVHSNTKLRTANGVYDVDAFIVTTLDALFRKKDDAAHTTTVLYKSTPAQAYEHKCAVARRARVSFRTHVSTAPPDE